MRSADPPTGTGPRGRISADPGNGVDEHPSEEAATPVLVLPDPPASGRPRRRRLLFAGAVTLLLLAGVSALIMNRPEDGGTLRRAATGELAASAQPELEFRAPLTEARPSAEGREAPSPATPPARPREGADRPAVMVDELALARRDVAEQVRAFDRRRAEFESGGAECRGLAAAYATLDRAFVRFSTLLARAGRTPSDADGRLFEIVDQESAAFDRSGCPRPS